MINKLYLVYILVGIVNGLFSSGAGQILVFYMIFIQKKDSQKSREFSLIVMPIISIISLVLYFFKYRELINLVELGLLCIISVIFGLIGNKVMNKLNPNLLNLVSGILLVVVTSISLWRMFLWYT